MNTNTPTDGSVAIMLYEKSGLTHYAYVEHVFDTGVYISECNMFHLYLDGCGTRFVSFDYPALQGFYTFGDK